MTENNQWPETEDRIDAIGQNGPTGDHYAPGPVYCIAPANALEVHSSREEALDAIKKRCAVSPNWTYAVVMIDSMHVGKVNVEEIPWPTTGI